MPICTPDVLIGVGGGGTRIVHRILRRDDVLEQVLTDDGSEGLSAAIIDTETDGDWHREAAARTREGFEAVRARVDGQPGGLSLHGPVLLPEALGGDVPARLTSRPFVRDLCEAEGLDNWWLDDRTEPLQTFDDAGIGGGTYRFRSLAKALYHAASFSGGSIAPPTTADDDVALVASLGGGTGSGTVLDLTADLEGRRTDLYVVLPHPSESTAALANAYAALSELEHAFLAGESPFDTVTLLPFPADADPAAFEANAVRAFLAHQGALRNGGGPGLSLDLSGGPTAYAPFTVATTHTVKYPISAHEEAREAVAEFLERKLAALEAETERYDIVESFLRERFPATAERVLAGPVVRGGPIDEAAARSLRSRLVDDLIGTTLEDPVFEQLEFGDSLEAIRTDAAEVIENGGRDDGADAVRDFVASAPGTLASIAEHHGDHAVEAGGLAHDFVDAVETEFRTVERRRDLLAAIEAITAEETALDADDAALMRRGLRRLLDLDRGYPPTDISELEKRSMAARETVDELDGVLADAESFREEVREEVREELHSWAEDVSSPVERLIAIGERAEAVRDGIYDLVDAVERAVSEVEAATTVEAVEEIDLRLPEADAVNAGLNEIGVDPIDVASIRDAFDHVKGAKRAALESQGLLSGILGPDWTERYEAHVRQADEWFEVPPHPDPFSCSFEVSRLEARADAIDDRRAAAVDDVVEAFADRFRGREPIAFDRELGTAQVGLPDEEALDGVLDRLETALDALARGRNDAGARPLEGLFGGISGDFESPRSEAEAALVAGYLDPIADARETAAERRDRASRLADRLDALRDCWTDVPPFDSENPYAVDTDGDSFPSSDGDPYVTHFDARPDEIVGVTGIGETDLVKLDEDLLAHRFAAELDRAFDDGRVPVDSIDPAQAPHHLSFRAVYHSRAYDSRGGSFSTQYDQVRDAVAARTGCSTRNYRAERHDIGGPDEVSLSLFTAGVPLDRLTVLADYEDAYRRRRDALDEPLAQHAVGLGADWTTWPALGDRVREAAAADGLDDAVGGSAFRETVRDRDALAEAMRRVADGADPLDVFGEGFDVAVVETTVDID